MVRKGKKGKGGEQKKKAIERETIAKDQVRRWSCWNCQAVNWLIPMSE